MRRVLRQSTGGSNDFVRAGVTSLVSRNAVATPPKVPATDADRDNRGGEPGDGARPGDGATKVGDELDTVWSETFWPMASFTVTVMVDFSPQRTVVGEAATVMEAGGPMTVTRDGLQMSAAPKRRYKPGR